MIQKARYDPIHIALEEFDHPMIRIDPAPFLPCERFGWRKFLSSLYDGILLQEDDCWAFAGSVIAGAALKKDILS